MTAPSPTSLPLDALWRPAALMAVVLAGEALALIMALSPAQSESRLVSFGLASLAIQWVALGTLAALYLLRRALRRLSAMQLAWACLSLLLGMTLLLALVAWNVVMPGEAAEEDALSFVARTLALALVVGLAGLLAYRNYWHARQLAVRTKQLELDALQARIRPHFLFNTLNTGAALVHARPADAERVLLDLADLFRSALRGARSIALAEELSLARRYLEIESLRFGERLQVAWDLPPVIPEVEVPSLSIQPLVENAIRHGIERRPAGGRIEIAIRSLPGYTEVTVANDLPGVGGGSRGHAVGLASSRERMRALGGHGDVEARLVDGRHVATMRIPTGPA